MLVLARIITSDLREESIVRIVGDANVFTVRGPNQLQLGLGGGVTIDRHKITNIKRCYTLLGPN